MKTNKVFFDTNILLYLLSEDTHKADRAEATIAMGGIMSVQVLNEFSSVASHKLKMTYAEIHDTLSIVRTLCQIQAVTINIHERGLDIAKRYGYSLYDSMVISAALESGCKILYSEDMQHGQKIDAQLMIANPFLE